MDADLKTHAGQSVTIKWQVIKPNINWTKLQILPAVLIDFKADTTVTF